MTKPILMKTMKRILFGLIAVGVLAAMFWYVNTYIYQFYAANPTVGVDSTSTVANVTTGSTFNVSTILSTQKVASADLVITYDKDKVVFQDTITSVPPNYFKLEYKKLADGTTNQSKLRLILIGETTSLNSVQLNLSFKALKSGTATIAVTSDSVIAGVDATNKAVIFDEDLVKASKTITITDGTSTGGIIAHWKMDDNVSGNGKTIDDFISTNDAITVVGANSTGINCTVEGKKDKSCLFDGVDDFLRGSTNLTFGTKATVTTWVKTTDTSGAIFGIVGTNYSESLALRISEDRVEGLTDYSSNWPNNRVRSTKSVSDNQWHYIAFVVDNLNAQIYIDGVLNATAQMQSGSNLLDSSWAIGYSDATWAPAFFAGQIDDLKLYNTALTAAEIAAEAGITPTTGSTITPTTGVTANPSVSPTAGVSPSASPTSTPIPVPTPPWENTNYSTTTVFGIVQDADAAGAGIQGKYWRKDNTICANATYQNAAEMNVSGNYLDKCQGFNNLPYFLTVVNNPGTNIAYQLQNIPTGYECVSWEHRLRIKSDGSPFTKTQGTGCSTGPLEIVTNNASSSYENSHLIWFKIRRVIEITPTSPLEQFESALNMKVKLQGIQTAPREQYRKININVVLKGGGQTVKEQVVEFSAQQDGTWTGALGVDGINAATKYELILKGAKHLAKKICVSNPSEQLGGTYRCNDASITLQKGANELDFSKIILLGGDLPTQDGLINAVDFAFIRQNLGSQDPQNLIRGDINLDGIIDTQDHTALKTALDFKYDEE